MIKIKKITYLILDTITTELPYQNCRITTNTFFEIETSKGSEIIFDTKKRQPSKYSIYFPSLSKKFGQKKVSH